LLIFWLKPILFLLQIPPVKAERQLTSSTDKKKKHFSEIKFGIKGGGGLKNLLDEINKYLTE